MAIREQVAGLLRRATFGPRAEEVDAAERLGVGGTLDALFPAGPDAGAARTPPPRLGVVTDRTERSRQLRSVALWWLDRMVAAEHQAHEKLTFFWHGHWATSADKVRSAPLMLAQQQTLFGTALGPFADQVRAMLRDPALIMWLDGQRNTVKSPNENLARELMELFTLGIGHYSEDDVRSGARALTGWTVEAKAGTATFNPKRHDGGDKTILGRTGPFDADSFADLLLAHPACAEFVARRLWFRYGAGGDPPAEVLRLAATEPTSAGMLRAVLAGPGHSELVKQPVEWAVGAMRQLAVRPAELSEKQQSQLLTLLDQLGQVPLRPPSVGGWPAGAAWLTTSATQVRLRAAQLLAGQVSKPVLDRLTAVAPERRTPIVARLLVVDEFSARTRGVLDQAAANPRQLLTLALVSPEYLVI